MTHLEIAKMNRNAGSCVCLTDNAVVYSTDPAFLAIATKMKADAAIAVKSASDAAADNSGYSADKLTAKNLAGTLAITLSASAQVKLDALANKSVSKALNSGLNFYNKASDATAAARMQNVHDVMVINQSIITDDYVTLAQLTDFQTKINAYTTMSGTSINVKKTSPTLTKKFKSDLKNTSNTIISIKKLVKKYKTTNPTFFNSVMASCKIPAVNVHHTTAVIAITSSTDGSPLENVAGTLTKSTEVPVSDADGIMTYNTMSSGGVTTATFVLEGYTSKTVDYTILLGETNSFSVAMDPIELPTP